MHIGVAKPFQMGQHRHPCFAHHPAGETLAAAGNDQIDGAVQPFQHQADSGAVGVADILNGGLRQARCLQPFHHGGMNGAGGMDRIRTATQDGDIARLERDGAGVGGHIGAAFIDDADHADGRGHAGDVQPIGPGPARQFPAVGIRLPGHVFHAFGHGLDARVVQGQPVQHGGRHAACFRSVDIARIGGQDFDLARTDGGGGGTRRAAL